MQSVDYDQEFVTKIIHSLKVSKNIKVERLIRRPLLDPLHQQMHHSHLSRSTTLLWCHPSSENPVQGSPTYLEGTEREMLFLFTTD